MKKTLITGATGHLGGRVATLLADRAGSEQLAVLARPSSDEAADQFRQRGIEVRHGDFNDRSSLDTAFAGIEVLYFVSSSDIANRNRQHRNVVDAARAAGVDHIIYTSSARKTEGPDAVLRPILESHLSTEQWIRDSGIAYTILQHNLYAEVVPLFIGDRAQLLKTKSIYLPAGAGRVALAPRTDLAEAEAALLADPSAYRNRVMELSGSQAVTFAEIAAILSDILGKSIGYTSPERADFRDTLAGAGVPEAAIGMTDFFAAGIAQGELDGQSGELEKLLGHSTRSLKEFLTEVYG